MIRKVALPLVLALVGLAGCGETPLPEQEVRAWVAEGHRLAEEKQRRDLVSMISPDYADDRGNGRDDIEKMFLWYFMRMNSVELIPSIEKLTIVGDTAAELTLAVGMAGTNDGTLGFSADAYRFEMELIKDDDRWLLLSARWNQIGETPR